MMLEILLQQASTFASILSEVRDANIFTEYELCVHSETSRARWNSIALCIPCWLWLTFAWEVVSGSKQSLILKLASTLSPGWKVSPWRQSLSFQFPPIGKKQCSVSYFQFSLLCRLQKRFLQLQEGCERVGSREGRDNMAGREENYFERWVLGLADAVKKLYGFIIISNWLTNLSNSCQ